VTAAQLIKPYFAENRLLILIGFFCLILVDLLQLFVPRIIKKVVDDLTAFQIDIYGLITFAAYIGGIGIAMGVFRYLWRRCLLGTSRRVEEGLRNQLFTHIETLSAPYFDKTKTGDLMAHATNDLQQVRMATGMGLVALNDAVFMGAAAIGFMLYIHVNLTLFVLIPMPFIVLGTRYFGRKMHRRYQDVQESFADLTEGVRERLAGIRIVKAYGTEETEQRQIERLSGKYVQQNVKLVTVTGSFFPLMLLFSNTSLAIVLYLGGRQTILQQITAGDFVAFISYLGLLTWPMMAMGWVTNLIQRGRASLDRIQVVLQTPPDITDAKNAVPLRNALGRLRFDGVGLSFNKTEPPALSDIHIDLEPGKTLGIIGPPGSGKTSLLNLRAQIAYVPQEPFMFAGTILDNITLGDRSYGREMIERAAEMAAIYTTIQSLPLGFETVVGEKGIILSGGQKQRIALARALLSHRPLLLLDDPISQVDTDTGTKIINTIRSLAGKKTILIVSHRLSALGFTDRIISLNKGRIIEYGTHAELMANDKYYAHTFRLQEIRYAT
jgi:ATP-binding cassette subfamily B multidrug efflux pump